MEKQKCKSCEGTGLVRRKFQFRCQENHPEGVITCMYCENVSKANYVTCEECYGEGMRRKHQ
jgi:DnaJ-class molecular chaperone